MSDLQERLRCALQRNNREAAPCRCGGDVVTGKRFKDHRGAVVTIIGSMGNDVIYLRDGCHDNSCLPLKLFIRKFTEVIA